MKRRKKGKFKKEKIVSKMVLKCIKKQPIYVRWCNKNEGGGDDRNAQYIALYVLGTQILRGITPCFGVRPVHTPACTMPLRYVIRL